MTKLSKFRRKFWLKVLVGTTFGYILTTLMLYLLHRVSGNEFGSIKYYVIPGILGIVFIPIFLTKLYPSKEERIKEFEEFEDKFEETGNELIINTFGEEVYDKLYRDDFNEIPIETLEVCEELLSNEKCKGNNELSFYIYVKMAKSYFKDSSYQSSIEYLKKALSIKPHDFYTNFRIAELYEMVSEGELAVNHYESSTKSPDISSGRLQQHVYTQINRVKTKGPSLRQPPQGFKWLTG